MRTLSLNLVAGRDFSDVEGEDVEKVLLSRSAARSLGHDTPSDAVGTTFSQLTKGGSVNHWDVIGVVEDFHYEPLQRAIRPAFVQKIRPQGFWLIVRLTGDIRAGMASLKETWSSFGV